VSVDFAFVIARHRRSPVEKDFRGPLHLGDNDGVIRCAPNESHNQLLRELNEERASALRRISGTLESLLLQLRASRERVHQAPERDREREMAAWRDLRAQAVKYRWYLEVQREALGMRRHDVLDEFYTVPSFD